ncbi:MAG: hypothetical protein Q8O00_12335, partial [Holophaga sp.]|nr:hypothetical protein [Holophaga sp.]
MPVLRQTLRALLRSPGFAVTVILTLALGMGSATAILGVLQQTLLRKPHPNYERLAVFGSNTPHFGFIANSYP